MNTILKLLFTMYILPAFGKFVANSTQILTDMNTVIAAAPYSTTAQANALAAAGPMLDLAGTLQSIKLNFQEAVEKLAYILSGSMVQASLTAPTGGIITTASDSATYNLLVGIYQILK